MAQQKGSGVFNGMLAWVLPVVVLQGCFYLSTSTGGGQTDFQHPRKIQPLDVALPLGYRIEAVAQGLTFPTGVTFDEAGEVYVVESGYAYGEVWTVPRLLHIASDGQHTPIAQGNDNGPWTGAAFHEGAFYVAEGGERKGGRLLRIQKNGRMETLIENLPSVGDHHTNGPVISKDGWIYWGQGTATNSGVVGVDNAQFGWLSRHPSFHDIPCRDVVLKGRNYLSSHPLREHGKVSTGAFSPFGTSTSAGQVIPGQIPCHGAVLRMPVTGGQPKLFAWGFRNPFGLMLSPDGHLYVTDNSYDVRGSRPVFGTGDLLWKVREGAWYGWPDFHGLQRLNDGDRFAPPGTASPQLLLDHHPQIPPAPVAVFGVHSSSNGLDMSVGQNFGYVGQAFVAQFGDQAPGTGKVLAPVGFKVVRVDVDQGTIHEFAFNKGDRNGPASWLKTGGLERPVAVKFSPDGSSLYVVDFGVMLMKEAGPVPQKETGVLWRITKS